MKLIVEMKKGKLKEVENSLSGKLRIAERRKERIVKVSGKNQLSKEIDTNY